MSQTKRKTTEKEYEDGAIDAIARVLVLIAKLIKNNENVYAKPKRK